MCMMGIVCAVENVLFNKNEAADIRSKIRETFIILLDKTDELLLVDEIFVRRKVLSNEYFVQKFFLKQ